MKKYIISIIMMTGLAFIAPGAVNAATLSLSSASGSFTVGSIFTANIMLDTAGAPIDGVDIRHLNYNPALLEAQDENTAVAGTQIISGNLMPSTVYNSVDTANGRITFSQIISGNNTFSGSGVLAVIHFKVLNAGSANVNFDFTLGNTADTNVAQAGSDVLNAVTNGVYILSIPPPPPPTAFPTLSLVPSAEQDPTGASFPVRIYLDTQGRAIDGVDVVLNFDKARLLAEDEDFSAAGLQILPGSLLSNTTANEINNTSGKITFSQTTGGNNTFNGSGVLATIYFKALAEGAAFANFDFTKGKTSDTNASFGGADILDSVTNGVYTITSNGLAPILSDSQPTGVIFMPKTLSLKISTNESATCRYSSTPNTPYDSMKSSFSASKDGLSHTESLSSKYFQLGSNSFYVRCKDKGGSVNQSDFLISFNIITDTIAPYISNPNPIGNFFMPSRYLSLSISTNEATSCKYSTVPDVNYDLMKYSFSASKDGLTHTAKLSSNFQLGQNNFYTRCKDKNSGNANQSDYLFSFNLLTPPKFIVGLEEAGNPHSNKFTLSFLNSGIGSKAFEFSAYPDSNGVIALPNDLLFAPSGYDIIIASPYHLARKIVNVDTVSGATVNLPVLPAGDLNSDGAVNSLDWSVMNINWTRPSSSADINNDNKVNSVDWGYLRKNWLRINDN